MKWSEKKKRAGRPLMPIDKRRVVMNVTVAANTAKWLKARKDSPGRVIDNLVDDFLLSTFDS